MPEACMGGEGRGSMEKMSGRPPLCHTRGGHPPGSYPCDWEDPTQHTARAGFPSNPGLERPAQGTPRRVGW